MTSGLQVNLEVVQNNVTNFILQAFLNGSPLNLSATGTNGPFTARVIVKASQTAVDNTGTTYNLTPSSGKLGFVPWTLPGLAVTTAGSFWWRFDVIDSGSNVYTCMFGVLTVLPA